VPHLTLPGGDQLFYETQGAGQPLLLVPGLSGTAGFYDRVLPALATRFRVILHDHRGCGRSSLARIEYSVEQMAGDVLALMDHLGIERAHLIGHSTGGAIGQTLALDHPQRLDRLVLSATWAKADAYFMALFDQRSEVLRRLGPGAYTRSSSLFLHPPFWVRDHPEVATVSDEEAARRIPDPEIVLRRIAAIQRFDRRDELHRIRTPTLVIAAGDDMVTPAYFSEEIGRLIRGAETVILPDGGHFYPNVRPEITVAHLLRFLDAAQA
jgi:aminoacrylate hydrolase